MVIIRFNSVRGRCRHRSIRSERLVPLLLGIALVTVTEAIPALERLDLSVSRGAPAFEAVTEVPATRFPICASGRRHTCVVDGDTFWYGGQRIRVADINTPETGQPRCAAEAALGARATQRLKQLLEAGPFTLVHGGNRDEDAHGRKLRIAMRDGYSLGEVLVAENLAHRWQGQQESWCDGLGLGIAEDAARAGRRIES